MSGHSKWHNIKEKKGATDAKRGKVFTRHAALIAIAAKSGGDPSMNPGLRFAIDNAKRDNVPNANIERAIKRGTGELKGEAQIEEITYEGYGPGGIAVIVECLTDNKNRTFTNLRILFDKRGGNIGGTGSVAWMFERQGTSYVPKYPVNIEDAETAKKVLGFVDALEEDEDVSNVTSNFDIPEELMEKIAD
ncbi:YebC/PmpR family DNA-binding transcriptional regulator [Candidatus Peregrinibacteria bacterium]|nr:YebC/PmpR family DNA-binding transcriptional regulator [Candidatus Peregrinibacteria bacterium]